MKKILLSVVCLVMVGMQSVNAQLAIAALHHEGNVTVFGEDKIASAIEAAVAGDTVYVSEGTLTDLLVTKKIHIVGSGQGTVIWGDLMIDIPDGLASDGNAIKIENLNVSKSIQVMSSVNELKIKKVRCNSFSCDKSVEISYSFFDNCWVDNISLKCFHNATIANSKIKMIDSGALDASMVSFINCNIYNSYVPRLASFYNSIVRMDTYMESGNGSNYGTYLENCIFIKHNHDYGKPILKNCWTSDNVLDDNMDCTLTDEQLLNSGYIGTDNKVVGITGGDAPYTLKLITPRVLEHNIVVDKENKKLNVTLTVGTE